MSKLKKFTNKIKENSKILKEFGIKFAINNFFESIICRNNVNSKFGAKIHKKSYNDICTYLEKEYKYINDKYRNVSNEKSNIKNDSFIFMLWWQGEEELPENIKICINSVRKKCVNHKVCIIDKNNYNQYIELPEYIIKKFNDKVIGIAHFSDIIRLALLSKYGGIWLDSTFFLTKPFDNEMYNLSFYTINHGLYSDFHVCKGKWTIGLLAVAENNVFMKYLYECLCEYWKKQNVAICYLLLDCFINVGYNNLKSFRDEIDRVPVNNTKTFELENEMSQPYNKNIFDLYNDTYIYRLTYKLNFDKFNNGKSTLYNEILNENIK